MIKAMMNLRGCSSTTRDFSSDVDHSGDDENHRDATDDVGQFNNTPRFSAGALIFFRIVSAALSLAFSILLAITIQVEGSPFYWTLLTQKWMRTTLVDYYLTLLPLTFFAAYRERLHPGWAVVTVVYFVCLGSTAVWSYIFLLFLRLRSGDLVTKILA